jgi:hypothetical protein
MFSVKENIVPEPKEVKTGCNLADSSNEAYDSKRTVYSIIFIFIFWIRSM